MTRLTDLYCDAVTVVLALLQTPDADVGYDKARKDILAALAAADTQAAARFESDDAAQAKFAVCAWIDEAILRSNWPGAKTWGTSQLQQLFFSTHNAGTEFYERLAALRGTASPALETYALCLGLGFRGAYFVDARHAEHDTIRHDALLAAAGVSRVLPEGLDGPLFPHAYQATAAQTKKFNPWAFDWWFFLIPVLSVLIAAELYVFFRQDLNLQLLGFFGSLG